jgi:hypothetical protein
MKSTAEPGPKTQQAFIEKAIRSTDEAERTGEYFDIGTVMEELAAMLQRAKRNAAEQAGGR